MGERLPMTVAHVEIRGVRSQAERGFLQSEVRGVHRDLSRSAHSRLADTCGDCGARLGTGGLLEYSSLFAQSPRRGTSAVFLSHQITAAGVSALRLKSHLGHERSDPTSVGVEGVQLEKHNGTHLWSTTRPWCRLTLDGVSWLNRRHVWSVGPAGPARGLQRIYRWRPQWPTPSAGARRARC